MFVLPTDKFQIEHHVFLYFPHTGLSVLLGLHNESMIAMKHSGPRRKNVLGATDLSAVTSIPIWLLYGCHLFLVLTNQSLRFGARLSCFFPSGDNFPGSFSITLSSPIWLPVLPSRTEHPRPSSPAGSGGNQIISPLDVSTGAFTLKPYFPAPPRGVKVAKCCGFQSQYDLTRQGN